MKKKYTFIDLFAGCGGLSEGFYKQGFHALSHVEIDKFCCDTLCERMRYYHYDEEEIVKSVIHGDITSSDIISRIETSVENNTIDLIIGGPPCQAYSSSGRARDEFGMKKDPRNFLFEHYVKILNHFKPKMFVFENVIGLLTANINGVKILDLVFKALGEQYDISQDIDELLFNTAEYGVPQVRKRLIIIGVRKDLEITPHQIYAHIKKTHYTSETPETERKKLKKFVSVREAIGDLPIISKGEKRRKQDYHHTDTNEFLDWVCDVDTDVVYDHITRTQNDVDTERYRVMAKNKWTFEELLANRPDLNHAKRRLFNNSYTVQFWDNPARTIIAHLCKDGNQFIHPDFTQGRSISVREAARLQSFPDSFRFSGAMGQKFKQIGNAVPPLFANVIAKELKYWLNKV